MAVLDDMFKVVGFTLIAGAVAVAGVNYAAKQRPGYGKLHQLICTTEGKVTFKSEPTTRYIGTEDRVPGWYTGSGTYYPRGGELCAVYYVN